MPSPRISLVAAVTRDGGIGHGGDLVARLPADMRRFKQLTMGAPMLMGRKTWDSIGRALPGRRSIVVTRDRSWRADGAEAVASLDEAIALVASEPRLSVIGGAAIYALALPIADELQLTEIDAVLPADTFFPAWDRGAFRETSREQFESAEGLRYAFVTYKKSEQGD